MGRLSTTGRVHISASLPVMAGAIPTRLIAAYRASISARVLLLLVATEVLEAMAASLLAAEALAVLGVAAASLVAAEALEETLASLATAVLVAQEVLGALAVQEAPEETLASLATEVQVAREVREVLEGLVAQEALEETVASYSATAVPAALVGTAPTRRGEESLAGRWATTGRQAHGSLASRATTPGPISKAARTVAARLLQFRMPAPPALNHWARCAGALAMR
jgi:hypothetical protein